MKFDHASKPFSAKPFSVAPWLAWNIQWSRRLFVRIFVIITINLQVLFSWKINMVDWCKAALSYQITIYLHEKGKSNFVTERKKYCDPSSHTTVFSFDYFVTGKEISHRDSPAVFSFAMQLRSVTEMAPKSPLLCVKRIPVRCDFRASAKAKRTVSLGNHVLGKSQGHQSVCGGLCWMHR